MDFQSFQDFYPFYLSEHRNLTSRRLHVLGTILALLFLIFFLFTHARWTLFAIPLSGYGFAWAGHTFFEKNKPATFKYPWYSFLGACMMYKDILVGKIKL